MVALTGRRSRKCGQPTKSGRPCGAAPLATRTGRCARHAGIPPTEAQRAASRRAPEKHGYFVNGFRDRDERALFEKALKGSAVPAELLRQTIAAMVVRLHRLTTWEAEQKEASALATAAYTELRHAIGALPAEEPEGAPRLPPQAEAHRLVQEMFKNEPELALRQLPAKAQRAARAALAGDAQAPAPDAPGPVPGDAEAAADAGGEESSS